MSSDERAEVEKDANQLKAAAAEATARSTDFRLKQLDIGSVENAVFRKKWWQIWCVFSQRLAILLILPTIK